MIGMENDNKPVSQDNWGQICLLYTSHADTPLEVVGFNRAYEGGVSYFSRYGVKKQ